MPYNTFGLEVSTRSRLKPYHWSTITCQGTISVRVRGNGRDEHEGGAGGGGGGLRCKRIGGPERGLGRTFSLGCESPPKEK